MEDLRSVVVDRLQAASQVAFSKHVVNRMIERNVLLSMDKIARLNQGVNLAEEKSLEEPLIMVDGTIFLVSIRHNKVITTMDATDLLGNVFTNIDGAVII